MRKLCFFAAGFIASSTVLFFEIPYAQGVSPDFQQLVRAVSPGCILGTLSGAAGFSYVLRAISNEQEGRPLGVLRQFGSLRKILVALIGFMCGASVCELAKSGQYSLGVVTWLSLLAGVSGLYVGGTEWFSRALNKTSAQLTRICPLWFWIIATFATLCGQMIGAGVYFNTTNRWLSLVGINAAFFGFGIFVLLLAVWIHPAEEAATAPE